MTRMIAHLQVVHRSVFPLDGCCLLQQHEKTARILRGGCIGSGLERVCIRSRLADTSALEVMASITGSQINRMICTLSSMEPRNTHPF